MAGVSLTNQYSEYPLYLVRVKLDVPGSSAHVNFWIGTYSGFSSNDNYPSYGGGIPPIAGASQADDSLYEFEEGPAAYVSLFSAVKAWAQDFDWTTLVADSSYNSIAIIEFSESSADVTPS